MKKFFISLLTVVMMTAMMPISGYAVETQDQGQIDGTTATEIQPLESDELTEPDADTDEDYVTEEEESLETEPSVAPKTGKTIQNKIPSAIYKGPQPLFPNAIGQKAIQLAWPYGTPNKKLTYPKGKAKKAFRVAIEQVYGERKGWSKQCKAGASCDVFVGTVVRACGYDSSFPRALEKDLSYLPNSSKFKKVKVTKSSQFLPGDIILYNNKGPGGHIAVYVEINNKGYIAEASYTLKRTGRIARKAPDWHPKSFKYFGVFRAKSTCLGAIEIGDKNEGVKNLQLFLNWAGFSCGEPDGDFGPKTEEAVIAFQEAEELEPDGKFGSMSYEAARKYTNWTGRKMLRGKNASSNESYYWTGDTYNGKFPTKPLKYKVKKAKKHVKRWQKFLRWYGYSVKVDGKFGKKTRKLTKKFQRAQGLKADGVVGKDTISKAKKVTR